MDTEQKYRPRYWSRTGEFQEDYNRLHAALVPKEGSAKTRRGQLLRYVSNIYYDVYNNGGCNLRWPSFKPARRFIMRCMGFYGLRSFGTKLVGVRWENMVLRFIDGRCTDQENDTVSDVVIQFVKMRDERATLSPAPPAG